MPKLDEVESCLAADKGGVKDRVDKIKGKKKSTQIDLYKKLLTARRWIDENFEKKVNIQTLAKEVGVADAHFSREFKQAFQLSPYQYVLERRMARARHLLSTTKLPITEISLSVGYDSLGSFTSTFSKYHKRPPAKYRDLHG